MSDTARLIPRSPSAVLPVKLEDRLRRLLIDRFTGNVQLNIKDGRILGFRVDEIIQIAASDH